VRAVDVSRFITVIDPPKSTGAEERRDRGGEKQDGRSPQSVTGQTSVPTRRQRLGEFLLEHRVITTDQLAEALGQRSRGEKLGAILVRMGIISEPELLQHLSAFLTIPVVSIPDELLDGDLLRLVPPDIARKYDVLPIRRVNGSLSVAMADPTNLRAVDDLTFVTSLRIVPAFAAPTAIRRGIRTYYERSSQNNMLMEAQSGAAEIEIVDPADGEAPDLSDLKAWADQAPVIRLVNMIFAEAISQSASDIHLEPFDSGLHVRYRIDGLLPKMRILPQRLGPGIVSRIKIMAHLDIAERRLPQDGRLKLRCDGREIDVRVSSMPTVGGESLCMRLLDRRAVKHDLLELGFDEAHLAQFTKAIDGRDGMVLITGPTGSGKTTTLYSAIERVRPNDLKIMTVEDPVEYYLDGVTQVAVHEDIGRTFAAVLRSFLRHDPDVLLVGEMRDVETAQTGIRAALTGHLVLTTLHTIDCPSAIPRLLDMGIPGTLLASCLRLTVAQRLVRRVCVDCREPSEVTEQDLVPYGHQPKGLVACSYRGRGCPSCRFTGMRGRVAIYEMMPTSSEIHQLVARGAPVDDIRRMARRQGMVTLREAGLQKVLEGATTLKEVLRATGGEVASEGPVSEDHDSCVTPGVVEVSPDPR
jgi:type IV pilus assembly protein PilB